MYSFGKRESDWNIFHFKSICLFSHLVPTVPSKGCAVCDKTANVSSCAVSQRCQPNEVNILFIRRQPQLIKKLKKFWNFEDRNFITYSFVVCEKNLEDTKKGNQNL